METAKREGKMKEEDIRKEARLMAIEGMVSMVYAFVTKTAGDPFADQMDQKYLDSADRATIPRLDPAMSDHFCAEVRDALEHLLKESRALRAMLG
jgi:hypothetical protein